MITDQFIEYCGQLVIFEFGCFDDIKKDEALESVLEFGKSIMHVSQDTLQEFKFYPFYEKAVSQQMWVYILECLMIERPALLKLDLSDMMSLTME